MACRPRRRCRGRLCLRHEWAADFLADCLTYDSAACLAVLHKRGYLPSYATKLVFFSGFPAWPQKGDTLYYANYIADKTSNPFIAYPVVAVYFILMTLVIIGIWGLSNGG